MTPDQEKRFALDRAAARDLADKIAAALRQPPLALADGDSPFILIRALQIVLAGAIAGSTPSPDAASTIATVLTHMLLSDTRQMASRRAEFIDTSNTLPI